MWRKVTWLFLGMTLAMWSGCAGENQNYEINKEPVDLFKEDPPTRSYPGTFVPDTEPSLSGVDRSEWTPIFSAAQRGRVRHDTNYFTNTWGEINFQSHRDRPSPVRSDADYEAQIIAATADADAPYDGGDVADTFTLTIKAALDVGTWPARAIFDPPWAVHHSPPLTPQ